MSSTDPPWHSPTGGPIFYHLDIVDHHSGRIVGRLGPFTADEIANAARRVVLDSVPSSENARIVHVEPDGTIRRESTPDGRLLAWRHLGLSASIVPCAGMPAIPFDSEAEVRAALGIT